MALALTILFLLSIIASPVYSFNSRNKAPSKNAVLLSNVQTLTLHADRKTSHRRVPAIPQLSCIGPSKQVCDLCPVDVMRCTNQGSDYNEDDVQWTCTAKLPPEFKFGSTDVVCEGYRNADDPWVLKGSCGVEYRLFLTDIGEERFGKIVPDKSGWATFWDYLFGLIMIGGVAVVILAALGCFGAGRRWNGGGRRGGGWGGGGGWWGPPGPPPPYDYQPPRYTKSEPSWRPGFWSGALGGAAAGYAVGSQNRSGQTRGGWNRGWNNRDAGEGSSRSAAGPSQTSTGFGSTRRR